MTGLLFGLVLPFGFMMLLMYFMIIKPQKKQDAKHKELLSELKVGDKVETFSGIIGRISSINETEIVVNSEGTKLRMLRSVIKKKVG